MFPTPRSRAYFLPVSSPRIGALGILHIHAEEAVLAGRVDAAIRKKDGKRSGNPLKENELRYGWLFGPESRILDEVMLARPRSGMRILMTHGGTAVREAVTGWLKERGFAELEPGGQGIGLGNGQAGDRNETEVYADDLYDPLLSSCITEAQAAAVLEARRSGQPVPMHLLRTRRLVLAGAPNAGKSSLLNQLVGYDRAFVHREAGATRDVVDELIDLGGYAVLAGDLPGCREGETGVAQAAWDMASRALAEADCVLFVADVSAPWEGDTAHAAEEVSRILRQSSESQSAGSARATPVLVVLNKSDLPPRIPENVWQPFFPAAPAIRVASIEGGNARETVARAVSRFWKMNGVL